MSKDNTFKSSMFGYDKSQVDKKISELESEINLLRNKIQEIKVEYDGRCRIFKEETEKIEQSKRRIADAYLAAQQNADNLMEQARNAIAVERHMQEVENEALKEVIVERKEAVRNIRLSVQSFSSELQDCFNRIIANINSDVNIAVKELDQKYLTDISDCEANDDIGLNYIEDIQQSSSDYQEESTAFESVLEESSTEEDKEPETMRTWEEQAVAFDTEDISPEG